MLKKVLVTLIASAFTVTAFAQAQPVPPKGETGSEKQQPKQHKKAAKPAKAKARVKSTGEAKPQAGK